MTAALVLCSCFSLLLASLPPRFRVLGLGVLGQLRLGRLANLPPKPPMLSNRLDVLRIDKCQTPILKTVRAAR